MTLYFWFNNVHFALEFFGGLVFFALSWLAFDALRARKDVKQVFKGGGFLFLALSQLIHALDLTGNLPLFFGIASEILGLALVLLVLFLEKPPKRPVFAPALVVLPAVSTYLRATDAVSFLLAAVIGAFAWWRYKTERNRYLVALWFAFSLLSLSSALSSLFFQGMIEVSFFWALSHLLRIAAFSFLAAWLWQYLETRVTEQLFLIVVLLSGIIGILVTFSFSPALMSRISRTALSDLAVGGKTVETLLGNNSQIAKSELALFAGDPSLVRALARQSSREVEAVSRAKVESAKLDFLTVALPNGVVLTRTHALTIRGDTVAVDPLFLKARESGEAAFDVEEREPEGLSVRVAVLVSSANVPVGVLLGGYLLDQAAATRIGAVVGHELKFYRISDAATLPDAAETRVFGKGESISGAFTLEGKDYLAYLSPIKNLEGKVVGAFAVREPQQDLARTVSATNRITLVTTLAALLLILFPAERALRRLLRKAS